MNGWKYIPQKSHLTQKKSYVYAVSYWVANEFSLESEAE